MDSVVDWPRRWTVPATISLRGWIFTLTSHPAHSKPKRKPISENQRRELWLHLVTCLGPNIRCHKQDTAGL